MKISHSLIAAVLAAGLFAACRRDDQVQTYSAPKEQAPAAQNQPAPATAMTDPNAPPVTVNPAPIHWTTPATWKELAPTTIRKGNLVAPGPDGKQAEVTITSFPGDVGGALANVNRWRRENGLGEVAENDLTSEQAVVDSIAGKLYDISGASARTVVAVISREGASWFFKMRGDPDAVAAARPAFLEFLSSVHFDGADAAIPAADPHAGMDMAGATAEGPKWNAPSNWSEAPPGPMVLKSYSVPGDAGQKATVSISVFAGEAGGTLNNVNRWRGQIGLPAIEQAALAQFTESLDVADGKATLVDFAGKDSKTGQPSRLVAAIVAHGGETWFYKLTGDGPVVGREKENFVKLVQTARY